MERTSIRLGGLDIGSSIMNASGARSAERGEIYELCAVHTGAVVFKSCNIAGLEQPENLKNKGVEYFSTIAKELRAREKVVIASVVGATENEFVTVAQAHTYFRESEALIDIVAVGGINDGRDAYIAHLAGARAMQVGSALMKEGAGALGRIDRELDALLAQHGKRSVAEIVGKLKFAD